MMNKWRKKIDPFWGVIMFVIILLDAIFHKHDFMHGFILGAFLIIALSTIFDWISSDFRK